MCFPFCVFFSFFKYIYFKKYIKFENNIFFYSYFITEYIINIYIYIYNPKIILYLDSYVLVH